MLLQDWAGAPVAAFQPLAHAMTVYVPVYAKQASIGGTTGFSDYGATFSHGSRVCLVLDMDAGTLRFIKDGEDQGIACCGGLKGKVLTPGIVMGTNKGGKRTKVCVVRSGKCFNSDFEPVTCCGV